MLPEAYEALAGLENGHWWFVGERHVYRSLIELGAGKPQGVLRMLEVGCGSGGNLSLLGEYGPTTGLELSAQALALVPQRPTLGLVQASAEALPFARDSFDGVHLLGVIEHLPDDQAALHEANRVCRAGGMVALLTSALPILWSHHDEANLHQRRYLRSQLKAKLLRARLAPIRLTYQNFFVFPPTLLVRLWQRRKQGPPRYDMGTPPSWINSLLILLVRLEAWLIRFISLPIGVDLVAACRVEKE
jgi:SAM-dependent methyltransferase